MDRTEAVAAKLDVCAPSTSIGPAMQTDDPKAISKYLADGPSSS